MHNCTVILITYGYASKHVQMTEENHSDVWSSIMSLVKSFLTAYGDECVQFSDEWGATAHTADNMEHQYMEINKTFPALWKVKSEVYKCTQVEGEC
jgi:hypothetical protein